MWNRNVICLITAQWLSFFGSKLHLLALPLIIYQRTGSARLLALGFLAETLPWMILAPKLSTWLEKHPPRGLLVLVDFLRAICCVILALMPYDTLSFLAVMFLIGTGNSVYGIFRLKVLRGSAESNTLPSILSLTNAGVEVIQIAAPALGGAILALGVSAPTFLLFDAISFVVSGLILWSMKVHSVPESSDHPTPQVRHGYEELLRNKSLRAMAFSESIRSLAEALFIPVVIVMVKENFRLSESYFGWSQATMSLGAVMTALLFARFKLHNQKAASGWALLSLGVLQLMLVPASSAIALLAIMTLVGAAMSFRQLSAELLLIENLPAQNSAPLISAYNSLISTAYVGGYVLSASLAGWYWSVILAGGICLFGALYHFISLRDKYARNQALPQV